MATLVGKEATAPTEGLAQVVYSSPVERGVYKMSQNAWLGQALTMLTSFMSTWHKLESSERREPQLRKLRLDCREARRTFS